jgi:DNA-binding GntR family transcriptional regulator
LLRNPYTFEIYNSMDLPELMRRVLAVAPLSLREVFDEHKGLILALRSGSADETCAAITAHVNRVRAALAQFQAQASNNTTPRSIHVAA